jgi:hypothetical protein
LGGSIGATAREDEGRRVWRRLGYSIKILDVHRGALNFKQEVTQNNCFWKISSGIVD